MGNGLTGTDLKRLALFAMLLDHIGAVFMPSLLLVCPESHEPLISAVIVGLRFVGRIAMPIYCFLLVEGFSLTTHLKNYILSIGCFALLSEIPFNLAVYGTCFHLSLGNVFFTLLFGLLFMAGDMAIFQRVKQPTSQIVLRTLNFTVSGVAAQAVGCDYGIIGIMLIAAFYCFRTDLPRRNLLAGMICVLESISFLGAAALSLIPISLYNGERGTVKNKYAYYAFYPLHLLLLWALSRLVALPG